MKRGASLAKAAAEEALPKKRRVCVDPPHALAPGSKVVVRPTVRGAKKKHAGTFGTVQGHDSTDEAGRHVVYEVQLDGSALPVTFAHDDLLQCALVVLHGLVGRADLNGKTGFVKGVAADTGRLNVLVEGGSWASLRFANLKLFKGTRVTLSGLRDTQHNGAVGRLRTELDIDAPEPRYEVELYADDALDTMKVLRVKPENVSL